MNKGARLLGGTDMEIKHIQDHLMSVEEGYVPVSYTHLDEEYTAEEAAEVLEVTQRNIRRLNQLAENLLQLNSTQVIEQR